MVGIIRKKFVVLLISIVNASIHARCISLSNQKWEIQPTLINLHPNENNQEFHYYPFAVILDRCAGRCNVLNDLSSNVCVPNKTDDLNLSVFNIVTGINESKTLTNHVSVNLNVNVIEKSVIQINCGIMINVGVSVTNIIYVKNIIFRILLHVAVKMENI